MKPRRSPFLFILLIVSLFGCYDVDNDDIGIQNPAEVDIYADTDGYDSLDSDGCTEVDTDATPGTDTTAEIVPQIPSRAPSTHRAEGLSCKGVHSPPEPTNIRDDRSSSCTKHADCTEGDNGRCIDGIGMASGYYYCIYDECVTDNDCDPGKICYCTELRAARCLTIGNCQVDADCGENNYCSPSMSWDCSGYRPIDGFHCHTPSDTCVDDADCTGTDYCNFNVYKNLWECTPEDDTCAIG